MLYTLSDKILPAYFEDFYHGDYRLPMTHTNPIAYRTIKALHYHKWFELGICLSGRGYTYVDNRIYNFSQGDMIVMPPNIPHLSVAEPGVETIWTWISVDSMGVLEASEIKQIDHLQELVKHSYNGVFHPWEYPRLADIICKMRDLGTESGKRTELELLFLAGELIMECSRIGDVDHVSRKATGTAVKVMPALVHIRTHYADKDAMKEECIAKTCNMSVSHFRAVFKKETGMTVRDFIIQTRLATAAHLLSRTDESVLSIALESGFGQISCFNRIFSRVFGETPTAFRRKSRIEVNHGSKDH